MMEKSEQSTNSQRTSELRAFKDLVVAALIFIIAVTTLVVIGSAVE